LWIFSGFYTATYFAGEVKAPQKNLLLGSWIALTASLLIMAGSAFFVQRLVPLEWLAAESYLSNTVGSKMLTMPWLPFYVAILHPSRWLIYFLGITWVFTLVNLAQTFLYTGSRVMLAWAEDHLIPESAGFVHPELRSPLITVLLICILAEMGVVQAALTAGSIGGVNPVFFIPATQLLPVLGITLLPFLKRDWFRNAPAVARVMLGPVPLISVVGGLSLVYLAGMMVALMIRPGFNQVGSDTLIVFGAVFLSGLVWYYFRRRSMVRAGEDVDRLLKGVPEAEK
jgi:amino acid transporter